MILNYIVENDLRISPSSKPFSGLAIFKYYEVLSALSLDSDIILDRSGFSHAALLMLTEYVDVSNDAFKKIFNERSTYLSQTSICLKVSFTIDKPHKIPLFFAIIDAEEISFFDTRVFDVISPFGRSSFKASRIIFLITLLIFVFKLFNLVFQ